MADFLLIAEAILEVDAKARGRLYPSRWLRRHRRFGLCAEILDHGV